MTDRDTVRLLTGLTAGELPDDQIDALLQLNGGGVRLAAADGLEAFAGTLTAVQSDEISIDGSKRAGVLMARAARLRTQAEAYGEGPGDGFAFDVVFPTGRRPELTERECW